MKIESPVAFDARLRDSPELKGDPSRARELLLEAGILSIPSIEEIRR